MTQFQKPPVTWLGSTMTVANAGELETSEVRMTDDEYRGQMLALQKKIKSNSTACAVILFLLLITYWCHLAPLTP